MSILVASNNRWLNTISFLQTCFKPETQVILEEHSFTISELTDMVFDLYARMEPLPAQYSDLVQHLYQVVLRDALQEIHRLREPSQVEPPTPEPAPSHARTALPEDITIAGQQNQIDHSTPEPALSRTRTAIPDNLTVAMQQNRIEPPTAEPVLSRAHTTLPENMTVASSQTIAVATGPERSPTPVRDIVTPALSPLSSPPSSTPRFNTAAETPAPNDSDVDGIPSKPSPIPVALRLPTPSDQQSTSEYSHTSAEASEETNMHSPNTARNNDCTDDVAQDVKAEDIDSEAEPVLTIEKDTAWRFTIRTNKKEVCILDTSYRPCNGGDNICRWGGCRQSFETWRDLQKHLSQYHSIVFKHSADTSGTSSSRASSSSQGGHQPTASETLQQSCQWFNGACPNSTYFKGSGSLGRHIIDHRFFYYCANPTCPPHSSLTIARGTTHPGCRNHHLLKVAYDITDDVDVSSMPIGSLSGFLKDRARSAAQVFHEKYSEEIKERFAEKGQEYMF